VDFNSLLRFDPGSGAITHRGTRVLITGTAHLGALRKYLLASYPLGEIREKFWKSGYDQGFADVLAIARTMDISDDLDFVKLGSALTGIAGAARLEIEKVDLSLIEGRVAVRARFVNSHEAVEYLRQIGPARVGVCWSRCGYAQGFLEGILDSPVLVVESECIAMGDPSCLFLITTDAVEAAAAAAAVAARGGNAATPVLAAAGLVDAGPALSADHIHELANRVSPRDKQRLVEYFARKDADLERSRLRYRALLDASPDVILEVGRHGDILLANESARTVLGRDPQALVGVRLAALFAPDDGEAVSNLLSRMAPGPTVVLSRVHFADGSGHPRVAELAVRSLDGGGARATTVVEIRDITERVRLEEQILEREARRRAVFEGAADGILLWGPDGSITDANPAAEKMLGFKPGGLNGVAVEEVIVAVKVPASKRKRKGGTAEPKAKRASVRSLPDRRWVGDAEIQSRRGEVRPAILSLTPITADPLKGSHLALIKDFSEVEALREELRVEKGKTDAIVEAISEPMIIFNERAEAEWRNSHAEFVFGRGKLIHGTPCHLVVCDRAEPCNDCPVAQFQGAAHNPGTFRRRTLMKTTDGGQHPFELTLRRLPEPGGSRRALAVFRDLAQEAGSERAILDRLQRGNLHLEVSDLLLSSRTLPEMLERFADRVIAELGLTTLAVLLRRSDDWLRPIAVFHGAAAVQGLPTHIPAGNTGLRDVLVRGQSRLVRDTDKSAGASSLMAVLERGGAPASNSALVAPLANRAGVIMGVLIAGRPEVDAFENEEVELWEGIAMRLGLALEGLLATEADQRVMKLQESLLAEADVLLSQGDVMDTARRFLEVMCSSTGGPSAGFVYRHGTRRAARLFLAYDRAGRRFSGPHPLVDLRNSPLLSRWGAAEGVQVIDVATLLKAEREDPVLGALLSDACETLVLIPSGLGRDLEGWIAITLASDFRISTVSEVDILRSLGQQSQLALSVLIASGRLDELRRLLESDGGAGA
jgi:PAS domain S-box-containing protein